VHNRLGFFADRAAKKWWQPVKIYTISRDGGTPEPLVSEQHRQYRAAWGPDDKTIAIGRPNRENPMTIELLDVKEGKMRDLPGSKDLWLPSWSADGRYIAAMSRDYRRLMVFDFTTSTWTEVAHGRMMGDFTISHDSKYVYFEDADTHLYRTMISGGTRESIATLKDLPRPLLPHLGAFWFGLTPDDSPLLMRNLGTQEIYSLDVQSK
jgi:Tol biopolymer transport system component